MPQKSAPAGFPNTRGCLQIGLAVLAVVYLGSLWLVPQLNPAFGLVAVVALAALGGIYVFIAALPDRQAISSALGRPSEAEVLVNEATAAAVSTPIATDDDVQPAAGSEPALATSSKLSLAPPVRSGPAGRERLAWLRTVLRDARRMQDLPAEGAYLAELGSEYRHSNQPRRAIIFYKRALRIARQIGDLQTEIRALGDIGSAYDDLGDKRRAIVFYERHLGQLRAAGDRGRIARASWNLGMAYEALGDLQRAIANMRICLNYERAVGHPDAEPDAALIEQLETRLASEMPRSPDPPPPPEK